MCVSAVTIGGATAAVVVVIAVIVGVTVFVFHKRYSICASVPLYPNISSLLN